MSSELLRRLARRHLRESVQPAREGKRGQRVGVMDGKNHFTTKTQLVRGNKNGLLGRVGTKKEKSQEINMLLTLNMSSTIDAIQIKVIQESTTQEKATTVETMTTTKGTTMTPTAQSILIATNESKSMDPTMNKLNIHKITSSTKEITMT
jgi:hypothetical protein